MPRAFCSSCLAMRECRETSAGLVHREISDTEYNHAKEVYLVSLAELKQLKKCRYIRARRTWSAREDRF